MSKTMQMVVIACGLSLSTSAASGICIVEGPEIGSAQIAVRPAMQTSAQGALASPSLDSTTLRQAASRRGLLFGAAVDANEFGYFDPLANDPRYGATLGTQYSMLEGENAMKWIVTHPAQSTYNFGPGDELVSFAMAHQMKVRGHTLVWGVAVPEWLRALASTASTEVMAQTLGDHLAMVVGHYKGKIFAWDVVNEAVDDQATGVGTQMKDSLWYNQPGIGLRGTCYVEQAFRWAHAADPDALLFYNEYGIETPGPKFQAVLNMVTDFVRRGVPIHGVGMQVHTDAGGWPDSAGLAKTIKAFTDLGLQVHLTEVDVAIRVNVPNTAGVASPADLQAQAATYQRLLSICLANPACTAFQTWGFTDTYSWIPKNHPGVGAALPFDQNYQPKPAFDSMMKALTASMTKALKTPTTKALKAPASRLLP